jgi:hypothetical protein
MNSENVCDLYLSSLKYRFIELGIICCTFICENFSNISKTDAFNKMDNSFRESFISKAFNYEKYKFNCSEK